jgi:hypothetical protein
MKKLFSIYIIFFVWQAASAQFSVRSGLGFSFSPLTETFLDVKDASNNIQVVQFDRLAQGLNGFFEGQYHFAEKIAYNKRGKQISGNKNYDLGISAPTMLGFGGIFGGGGGGLSFFYSTALMANYNMGSFAYNNNEKKFGFYAGLGFGVQNTSNFQVDIPKNVTGTVAPSPNHIQISDVNFPSYTPRALGVGPMIQTGIEFNNPFRANGSKSGLRVAYQPAINNNGLSYYTICILSGINGNSGVGVQNGMNFF